ncbi:MAG: hypothetical protein JOY78_16260 [Pseudonocardia sp.]|nr:hypothetical protein [Pseudonocardia sp.]
MGHPALRHPPPPSTSPTSADFRPRTYWRGPVWPFLNPAARLGVRAMARPRYGTADLAFAERYEPVTGAPLGRRDQARTAAAALERLG